MLDLSCPDWFAKLQAGTPPLPDGLPLDLAEAEAAIAVFDKLRLPDVPNKPLLRDVAAPWARAFVAAIFGLVEMSADRKLVINRPVRKFFQLVPKKNSKTTNGAAIMLTALLRNRRPNAEFLLVGPTQATAELAYDQAGGMVRADPWLMRRFHLRDHQKLIEDRRNGSRLRIKSFDNKVMTGVKPVAVLVDELHELGKIAYAQKVIAQIEGGIIANEEGFIVIITTQSDAPPAGVFKSELEHARSVRDGDYQGGQTLPMIYEFPLSVQADPEKAWQDPKMWPIVLPNLGRSISIDRLLPQFHENKDKGIEAFSIWASQHLNVQIGVAISGDNWIGAEYWADAADTSITVDDLIETSDVIVGGIDGGGLDDLYALALIGRHKLTRDWRLWTRAWAHEDVFLRRKEIVSVLEDFIGDGDLVRCSSPTQDVMEVAEILERVLLAGLLPEKAAIGLDPMGIAALVDELAGRGISAEQLVAVPQGFRLSGPIWGTERKLKDGTLWHSGSRMMNWVAGNAKVEQRGNAVLITKQAAGKAKIDPLMAAFNAVALMSRNPEALDVNASAYFASLASAA